MAIVTVVINKSGNLSYVPNNKVRHGDIVRFAINMVGGASSVTVNPPTCLDNTASFGLSNTSLAASLRDDPVSDGAAVGSYPFTVVVDSSPEAKKHGSELETKNGNLDVTTDPPKEA
ncbi:hypothetical protein [Comamonas sp. JC664]|uniref:hypothetical protein n=1 Tax=Comamonas sp. JC664 TaxID=2801917 RepID=UPI00174E36BD|nr:hypothetical protein [Comamonas sp. JC664]MBL0696993.1 hypothetical protein [Comamonas sp. JC664]GHG81876.1 hypothetical protein GCM10012319_35540 [Comamonas sp. KCTC 72670]